MVINMNRIIAKYRYVVWGIGAIIIVLFLLPGSLTKNNRGGQKPSQMVLATVNGESLPYRWLVKNIRMRQDHIAFVRRALGAQAELVLQAMGLQDEPMALFQGAFETSKQQLLLAQEAERLNIVLSPDYIKAELNDPLFIEKHVFTLIPMSAVTQQGLLDARALREYMRSMDATLPEFEQDAEQAIKQDVLLELLQAGLIVPDFEKEQTYKAEYLGKKYTILSYDIAPFIKEAQQNKISDAQLQDFYTQENQTKRSYINPEQRSGTTWTLALQDYGTSVDDEQVSSYYHAHKNTSFIKKPMQVQVRRILFKKPEDAQQLEQVYVKAKEIHAKLLANPETFAEVAKEVSEDPVSAPKGGMLEPVAKKDQHDILERIAFSLSKDNDISELLMTPDGFEIHQRVAKTPPVFKEFASVKKDIVRLLKQQEFEHDVQTRVAALSKAPASEKEALLARFLEQKKATTEELGSQKQSSDTKDRISQELFSLPLHGIGFVVGEGKITLIRVDEIKPESEQAFNEVKDQVAKDFYRKQAEQALQKHLDQVKVAWEQAPQEKIVADFGGTVQKTGMLSRTSAKGDKQEELKNQGIPVQAILGMVRPGGVVTSMSNEKGFAIRLDTMEDYSQEAYEAKKAEITKMLQGMDNGRLLSGFIASLTKNATIRLNESAFSGSNEESL